MMVVNLCGAPGAGKSTGAAYIFSQLKMKGINCELITEFAKDKVWEGSRAAFENQLYLFANQYFRMTRCENKVDVIITDSPLLLNLIYNTDKERLGNDFNNLVINLFNSYNNLNYFINRVAPYNPNGRLHTEEESDKLSTQIKSMFQSTTSLIKEVPGNISGYNQIVSDVIKALEDIKL